MSQRLRCRKKFNGVKRHLTTDMMGFVLAVVVHSAAIQNSDGGKYVFNRLAKNFAEVAFLQVIFADGGYAGWFLE